MTRPEDSLWDPIEGQIDMGELFLGFGDPPCAICGGLDDYTAHHSAVRSDGRTRQDAFPGE